MEQAEHDLTQCATLPVPAGYLIVACTDGVGCQGPPPNAVVIRSVPNQIGDEMTVLQNQPLPPGWVIVNQNATIGTCGGPFPNAWVIRKTS
jgi:hypothetical protein